MGVHQYCNSKKLVELRLMWTVSSEEETRLNTGKA